MAPGDSYDRGPRLDLSAEVEPEEETYSRRGYEPPQPPRRSAPRSGGGFSWMALVALLVSLFAAGLGFWSLAGRPEPADATQPPPGMVPGGTPERVAKLEKDVSALMLRLVTLEKELEALRAKAGPLTKLSELAVQVQALQGRIEHARHAAPAAAPAAHSEPAEAPAPRPAPKAPAPKAAPPAPAPDRPESSARGAVRELAREAAREADAPKPAPRPAPKAEAKEPQRQKTVYTVRPGDTLTKLAQRHHISVAELARWNDLENDEEIKVGQKLVFYK